MSLIGILIIIVGFILKLDTIAVVVSAGIITGLVSGMSISEILTTLGSSFINNRTTCLFMLTLPVIGMCERYGLKAKAIMLIKKAKGLSTGAILSGFAFIREATIGMGVTLGGHPQFVRPLINPMAEGASVAKYGDLDEKDIDKIKAHSAASDNVGNFFGQNLFLASPGVLLIISTLATIGIEADAMTIVKYSFPIAICAFILFAINNYLLDKSFKRKYASKENTKEV